MGYTKDEAVKSILVGAYNKCYEGEPKTGFSDLPPRFKKIAQFANISILIPIICVLAFLIGIATNYLSPTGKIHVIYNPIVLLILWNLIVYAYLIYSSVHRYSPFKTHLSNKFPLRLFPHRGEVDSHQKVPWKNDKPLEMGRFEKLIYNHVLAPSIIWINSLFSAGRREFIKLKESTANYKDVVITFMEDWSELSNHILALEFKRLFHIGSIALTLGAFLGIYLQGLFVEYNIIWTSTFISSKNTVSMLVTAIWGPAIFVSNLFGQDIIGDLNIEGLVSPIGVPAGAWIHLFFISTIIFILIPRSFLALWETREIRKSIDNIPLINVPAAPLKVKDVVDDCVFRTNNTIINLLDYFKLTTEEQRLLFSLEYCLSYNDAKKEKGYLLKNRKFKWIREWYGLINRPLPKPIVIRNARLLKGLEEVKQANLSTPKLGTILLEAAAFTPYSPFLQAKKDKDHKAVFNRSFQFLQRKKEKDLKCDKENHNKQIAIFCNALGFSEYLLNEAIEKYEEALKEIPPSNILKTTLITIGAAILLAITGGIAAPIIGGAVGAAMGLSGVAAVNAGLALLGGGAIAAGGLGMAGGTAVVIGGGAFLGGGVSSGVMLLFSNSNYLVLRELSKLEAVSKSFLKTLPNAGELIRTVIKRIQEMQTGMKEEISNLRIKGDESKKQIKELEIGIEYCEEAINRLIEFLKDQRI